MRAVGPDGKVQIAVDPRLVPLFQRSFPDAEVGAYDDRKLIDPDGVKELRFIPLATETASPISTRRWARRCNSTASAGRFSARSVPGCPIPSAWRNSATQLAALGTGPVVGVCWRSMMLGAKRAKYYSALDAWGPILKTPGVTFVNLQYGDCADELARAAERHGVNIHRIEGLDLKDDIDGAAALSAALDLVISAPTAAAATAASVGTEVWFLTAGRTWPQLGTDDYPWYARQPGLQPGEIRRLDRADAQDRRGAEEFRREDGFKSRLTA